MNTYGIMQGRLLPKFKGLYQAHPIDTWKNEFEIASSLGLDSIEFIFDYHLYSFNPIYSSPNEIREIIDLTGVKVKSICADFFMTSPIHQSTSMEMKAYGLIIEKLINNLSLIGGKIIVLPFVDNSSLRNQKDKKVVAGFLNEFFELCKKKSISFAIESDFNPKEFNQFLDLFKDDNITVNYDTGNSAALGFSFEEEINSYGTRISNIHIKDRVLGGGPIILGKGNAELFKIKSFIKESNYDGLIIFQAYRDDKGIEIFKEQYQYFLSI